MSQFSKRWEDLTIADNFIFCKVMQDESLCRRILEVLLDLKINRIEYIRTENPIENFYDSRGVRLDVYVKDSDRVFNIEIQTGNYDDLLLRARYYLSSSDVATTKRRTKFKDIKETYILFICKDDPFGLGIPRYTKVSRFKETEGIPYDDKTHNVFYNCGAWEKETDPEVREVLKLIHGLKPDSGLALEMEDAVFNAMQQSYLKDEYMYFSDILEDEKEEAREIGYAEGNAAGMAAGMEAGMAAGMEAGMEHGSHDKAVKVAKSAIKMGLNEDQIVQLTGLSLEEIQALEIEVNR